MRIFLDAYRQKEQRRPSVFFVVCETRTGESWFCGCKLLKKKMEKRSIVNGKNIGVTENLSIGDKRVPFCIRWGRGGPKPMSHSWFVLDTLMRRDVTHEDVAHFVFTHRPFTVPDEWAKPIIPPGWKFGTFWTKVGSPPHLSLFAGKRK